MPTPFFLRKGLSWKAALSLTRKASTIFLMFFRPSVFPSAFPHISDLISLDRVTYDLFPFLASIYLFVTQRRSRKTLLLFHRKMFARKLQNLALCVYIANLVITLHLYIYTGCPRRNVAEFGRVFLMLKYTDITQNTYIQIWKYTEIVTREKCGLLTVPLTAPV